MFLLKQILPVAIISLMVAAAVSGLGFFKGTKRMGMALEPLALGIGYTFGHIFLTGWITFPPTDTTNWLPCFALATAGLSAFVWMGSVPTWLRVSTSFLIFAGALRLLLKPRFEYGWSTIEGYCWIVFLTIATVLVAITLDAIMQRSLLAVELPVFLLIICAGTCGVLALSGSLLLGQFAVALSGAIIGSLVPAVWKVKVNRGIVAVFSLLLVALLVSGYFFAELPATSAALIASAPAFALIPLGRLKRLAFPVRASLVSVPILIALVVALRSSPPLLY